MKMQRMNNLYENKKQDQHQAKNGLIMEEYLQDTHSGFTVLLGKSYCVFYRLNNFFEIMIVS